METKKAFFGFRRLHFSSFLASGAVLLNSMPTATCFGGFPLKIASHEAYGGQYRNQNWQKLVAIG